MKLFAGALVAIILSGCSTLDRVDIDKNTIGPIARSLASYIDEHPDGDLSQFQSTDRGMNGFYERRSGFYASSTYFGYLNSMPGYIEKYEKAFSEICRRKGGKFKAPFCQISDSPEGIVFFALINDAVKKSHYSPNPEDYKSKTNSSDLMIYASFDDKPNESLTKFSIEKLDYYAFEANRKSKYMSDYSRALNSRERANYFIDKYLNDDPENYIPKVKEFIKQSLEEARLKNQLLLEKVAKENQEKIQKEKEEFARRQLAVRKVGVQACTVTQGYVSRYGPTDGPIYQGDRRSIAIKGIVEKTLDDRLLVRVSSIQSKSPSGQIDYIKEFMRGDVYFQVNQQMWDSSGFWEVCP